MKMKNRRSIGFCLPCCLVLLSQLAVVQSTCAAADLSGELAVGVSQRHDNLNWSIAGGTVNVLSELKWESMSITQLQTFGELQLSNDRLLRAKLGYGVISSGSNQDSDYNGNNRTQEFSRSISKAGGDVFDGSISLGKRFRLSQPGGTNGFYVTPFFGISVHRQNLKMVEGVQTLSVGFPAIPLGPFPGLDSSYDANWVGPWFGAEAMIEAERGWIAKAGVEYHSIDYSASANWNLRTDLAHPLSFRHIAAGEGIVMSLGATYPFGKNWKLDFILENFNWNTHAGTDQVFLANGTAGFMRLNAVKWDSTSCRFGVVREF